MLVRNFSHNNQILALLAENVTKISQTEQSFTCNSTGHSGQINVVQCNIGPMVSLGLPATNSFYCSSSPFRFPIYLLRPLKHPTMNERMIFNLTFFPIEKQI